MSMNFPKKNNSIKKVGRILTTIVWLTASQLFTNCKSWDTNISPIATVEKITVCRNWQSIQINKTDKLSTDLDTCPTAINIPSDYKIPVKVYWFSNQLFSDVNEYMNPVIKQLLSDDFTNWLELKQQEDKLIDYMPPQQIKIDYISLSKVISDANFMKTNYPELQKFRDFIVSQINNTTSDQMIFFAIPWDRVDVANWRTIKPRIQITDVWWALAWWVSLTGSYWPTVNGIKKNIVIWQQNSSAATFWHEISHSMWIYSHSPDLSINFSDGTSESVRVLLSITPIKKYYVPISWYHMIWKPSSVSIYWKKNDFLEAITLEKLWSIDKVYKFFDPANWEKIWEIKLTNSWSNASQYKAILKNNYIWTKAWTNSRKSINWNMDEVKIEINNDWIELISL